MTPGMLGINVSSNHVWGIGVPRLLLCLRWGAELEDIEHVKGDMEFAKTYLEAVFVHRFYEKLRCTDVRSVTQYLSSAHEMKHTLTGE